MIIRDGIGKGLGKYVEFFGNGGKPSDITVTFL